MKRISAVRHARPRLLLRQLQQLVAEAIAALDPNEPDHERIDVRDWLREARRILGRC